MVESVKTRLRGLVIGEGILYGGKCEDKKKVLFRRDGRTHIIFIKQKKTTVVRSRISSELIFASCV